MTTSNSPKSARRGRLQRTIAIIASSTLLAACASGDPASTDDDNDDSVQIPSTTIRFGHEPYLDHTQASIAIANGWFEDVGISIAPDGEGVVVDAEQVVPVFASGDVDVVSGSAQLMMSAAGSIPENKMFFFGDIFQGYAVLAQPDSGYRSASDFRDEGLSPADAIVAAVDQMHGTTFAYPSESAIRGFVELVIGHGQLDMDQVDAHIGEDPGNVALMQAGRADFQVGGVPSRLTLEAAGFEPIVTSADIAMSAEPSRDSEELRAVFHDGWLASDDWIEANHDTMLRLASVGFRINEYIANEPQEAASTHVDFLNRVAGTQTTVEEALVAYDTLHPFLTFDEQTAWHHDSENPFYGEHVIEATLGLYEEQGLVEPGEYSYRDFSIAHEVYDELLALKDESADLIAEAESTDADDDLLNEAKAHFDAFNFLDAKRFAEAALQ